MQPFIDAVRKAVAEGHWHAALALALTLPDICGAAEDPGPGKSEARYRRWWSEWAQPAFTQNIGPNRVPHIFLGGGDAYALRCAYLHSGSDVIDGQKASERLKKFILTYGANVHLNQVNDALQMDVGQFALTIADAVERWLRIRETDAQISGSLKGLVELKDARNGISF